MGVPRGRIWRVGDARGEAIAATRQLAKRQLTWLRSFKDPEPVVEPDYRHVGEALWMSACTRDLTMDEKPQFVGAQMAWRIWMSRLSGGAAMAATLNSYWVRRGIVLRRK
jgi:hypothetical protein